MNYFCRLSRNGPPAITIQFILYAGRLLLQNELRSLLLVTNSLGGVYEYVEGI